MEDAMVINKSSIERGFAHGAIYASEVWINVFLFEIKLKVYFLVSWFTRISYG